MRATGLALKKRFIRLFYYKIVLALDRSIRDNDFIDKDFHLSIKLSDNENEEEKKKSEKKSKINEDIVV